MKGQHDGVAEKGRDALIKEAWWKSRQSKMVFGIIAVMFFAGILIWFFHFHPYVSTEDARIDADIIRVANCGATQRIETVRVQEGSAVKKGDLLVELDRRIAQAQVDRARARARFTAAELERARALASQNGISRQALDRARSEAETSEAELRLAEIALDNTSLRSPVDGIVVQRLARTGNLLETNQTAITVVDIKHAWVSANIEETEVALVRPGQKVRISVDEGGSLTGTVTEVRQAAAAQFALIPSDNAAGSFIKQVQRIPIKVAIDPGQGRTLRVGQSVEIRIRVR